MQPHGHAIKSNKQTRDSTIAMDRQNMQSTHCRETNVATQIHMQHVQRPTCTLLRNKLGTGKPMSTTCNMRNGQSARCQEINLAMAIPSTYNMQLPSRMHPMLPKWQMPQNNHKQTNAPACRNAQQNAADRRPMGKINIMLQNHEELLQLQRNA